MTVKFPEQRWAWNDGNGMTHLLVVMKRVDFESVVDVEAEVLLKVALAWFSLSHLASPKRLVPA